VNHDIETRTHDHPPPPDSWPAARAAAQLLLSPIERFLTIEAASGILLLLASAVALLWANSPWHAGYENLWHTPIGLRFGAFHFEHDLHFWINDGLMVVFFFVVGLEIRRELHAGELSELRRAALPAFAALGGMVVPAALFLVLNHGTAASPGWGIPMATDIAFAVGILALLGKRVPPALRVLLLALAVIDDLGAILVIAVFYSAGLVTSGLALAGLGLLLVLGLQKLGVRSPWAYVPPGVVVWAGVQMSGVHPTIAGVLLGLLTPVRAWLGPSDFVDHATSAAAAVNSQQDTHRQRRIVIGLATLEHARREAVAPVDRLLSSLHGWVAFVIMPLFALANAGVPLAGADLGGGRAVFSGVLLGLVLGKPLGVMALSWLAVRAGVAALPAGVSWRDLLVVGIVAGIGFTMALFIAALAFPAGPHGEIAKLAILGASAVAAIGGLLAGRLLLAAPAA
jgi:NhaA family Na+:H+ antiporter